MSIIHCNSIHYKSFDQFYNLYLIPIIITLSIENSDILFTDNFDSIFAFINSLDVFISFKIDFNCSSLLFFIHPNDIWCLDSFVM